jgi:thiamine-monophosphate kinase
MDINKIGEFGLIDIIRKKVKNKDKNVKVDIGDDCAVIKIGNKLCLFTTDTLVEGNHFSLDYFKPEQIGKKAIEVNVSDIISMGGKPKYALVSLGLRKDLDVKVFDKIYSSIVETAKKYNIDIIGGNITKSKEIIIDINMIGFVKKDELCLRSQAKPGDFIFVTGPLGGSTAGLNLLKEKSKCFEEIKKKHLEPTAKSGKVVKFLKYINAMEDISDGLASEVKHICEESNVGAVIYANEVPIENDVKQIAKKKALDYALFGGEDFELVFTASKKNLKKVRGILIGEIRKKPGIFLFKNNKEEQILKKGYDHFLNS